MLDRRGIDDSSTVLSVDICNINDLNSETLLLTGDNERTDTIEEICVRNNQVICPLPQQWRRWTSRADERFMQGGNCGHEIGSAVSLACERGFRVSIALWADHDLRMPGHGTTILTVYYDLR